MKVLPLQSANQNAEIWYRFAKSPTAANDCGKEFTKSNFPCSKQFCALCASMKYMPFIFFEAKRLIKHDIARGTPSRWLKRDFPIVLAIPNQKCFKFPHKMTLSC